MRKYLLNSILVLCLALCSTFVAFADNTVYGLIPSWSGAQTTSFDIDAVTPDVLEVKGEHSLPTISEVKCAATAGDTYYAFVTTTDENGMEFYQLVTINFNTGNMVVIADYEWDQPAANVSGLTYDKATDALYAINIGYNDNDEYVTNVYKVNLATGELNYVTDYKQQFQAIASDNNGGFYFLATTTDENTWKTYPSLYHADSNFGLTPFISNTEVSSPYSYQNSMVTSADGKTVYYLATSTVMSFDVENKTVAVKGKLSDNVCGITFDKGTVDGTPADQPAAPKAPSTRFLVKSYTYGDYMGTMSDDIDSYRKFYYYNIDGKQVGYANYGREYAESGVGASDKFALTDITKSYFDENGNLAKLRTFQWGPYDFDDYGFRETSNTESFAYNENNQLIVDSLGYRYFEYTYNDAGYLLSKSEYTYNSKKDEPIQSIIYSDFDENGNPWAYVSDGAWDTYKYNGTITYDENGNKIEEIQYKPAVGDKEAVITKEETWTYDGDNLTMYYRKSYNEYNGEFYEAEKKEYKPVVEGDYNDVMVIDSTYMVWGDKGMWTKGELPVRNFYVDFDGMKEYTAVEFFAEPSDTISNCVELKFTAPLLSMAQDCKMVIYRDCQPIDSVSIYDAFDDNLGLCVYKDSLLKNGTYDYFVQPVFAVDAPGFGPLDLDEPDYGEGDFGDYEVEWVGYYSSNPQTVSVETKLPAVTDLKLNGGEVKTSGSILNPETHNYADITWTNPADADKYGFIKNCVFFVGAGVSEVETDAEKARVELWSDKEQVYVVSRFKLGNAVSDTITVTVKDIEAAAGVENVTVDGAVKATFAASTITLSDNANVTVFTTSGQKVLAVADTTSVSLANLPSAPYVVVVEKNGKVNAYKYSVK